MAPGMPSLHGNRQPQLQKPEKQHNFALFFGYLMNLLAATGWRGLRGDNMAA